MQTIPIYKLNWLLDQLRRNGGMTLEEIQANFKRSTLYNGIELSRRTFFNWRNTLRKYGIVIDCDKSGHVYQYKLTETQNDISEWLSDTMSVQQTIADNISIKDKIIIEPTPCRYLKEVLHAIKNEVCITIKYKDYWEDAVEVTIMPLFVKMHRQRWHVVGPIYNQSDSVDYKSIKAYGLDDRTIELSVTNTKFRYPSKFDAQSFYENNFSTIKFPEEHMKIEFVRILAWEPQNFYLRSVPLHHSQEEVYTSPTDGYSIFEYYIQPTFDFEMALLSHGNYVEVLAPKWFRKEVRQIVEDTLKAYKGYDRSSCITPMPAKYEPKD